MSLPPNPVFPAKTGLGNGGQNILKLHRLRQNQPIPAGSGQHLKLPKMVTTTETLRAQTTCLVHCSGYRSNPNAHLSKCQGRLAICWSRRSRQLSTWLGPILGNRAGCHAKGWALEDEEPKFASHLPGTTFLAFRLILTGNRLGCLMIDYGLPTVEWQRI